jgi:diadenosine tetraphosphatase ApaH/serine/threonine PP2A family protein phosphatase
MYIYIVLCSPRYCVWLFEHIWCVQLIFIINWIVRNKKYNNVYKHEHIHSLIIRNTQNDFDFVFNR